MANHMFVLATNFLIIWLIVTVASAPIVYEDDFDIAHSEEWDFSWTYIAFYPFPIARVYKIISVPYLPNVVSLSVYNNILSEFPDLSNCSTTIREIYLTNTSISYIPSERLDILTSLQRLWLHYNSLTAIPDVSGPGASLLDLSLSDNMFTQLPSISNLSAGLTHYYISGNPMQIDDIPEFPFSSTLVHLDLSLTGISLVSPSRIEPLTALQSLILANNELSVFPDLSQLADTLLELSLLGNSITDLRQSLGSINSLYNLQSLVMIKNKLTTVPNMCKVRNTIDIDLTQNGLICDCQLRWLKVAQLLGRNIYVDDKPCAFPEHLRLRSWNTITLDDLSCEGDIRTFNVKRVDPNEMTCSLPMVQSQHTGRSLSHCAISCKSSSACLMIVYSANSGDGACSLMKFDITATVWNSSAMNEDWYLVD